MVQGVNSKVMAEVLFAAEGTSKRDVKKAVDDELQKAISEGRVSKSEARAIKAEIRTNGYDAAIARQNTVEENVEAYKNGDKMSIGTNAALILDSKNLDIDNVVGLARTHGGEDFKLSQRQQKAFMEELNNQIENTGGKPLSKKAVRKLLNGIGFYAPTRVESFADGIARATDMFGMQGSFGDAKNPIASELEGRRVSHTEAELELLRENYAPDFKEIGKG